MGKRKSNLLPPWIGIEQDYMYDLSQNLSMTLPERMTWLLLALMQDNGHVPFEPGEIYGVLKVKDKKTGELRPIPRRTLYKVKAQLIERGILAKDQERGADRCFIMSDRVERSWRKASHCVHDPKPVRRRVKVDDGLIDPKDYDDDLPF